MDRELLVEYTGDQTRLAIVEDGELAEFYLERKGHEKLVGNIYKGRAANVLPAWRPRLSILGLRRTASSTPGTSWWTSGILGWTRGRWSRS